VSPDGSPDDGSLDDGSLDDGSLDDGELDGGELDDGSLDSGELDDELTRALVELVISTQFGPSRWFPPLDDPEDPGDPDDPDGATGDDGSAHDARFANELPDDWRHLLSAVIADLRDSLLSDDETTRRLYPTAYPDDAERNAEFAALAHDQLLMARLDGLDVVERTIAADTLSASDLTAWMQAINQARLVLGTRLDVTEDDPREHDPDHPEAPRLRVYRLLARLLGDIVDALHPSLPPGDDRTAPA